MKMRSEAPKKSGTPRKIRSKRTRFFCDEIPTRDVQESKSLGATPNKGHDETSLNFVRRSCPDLKHVRESNQVLRRTEGRPRYLLQNEIHYVPTRLHRSTSEGNLEDPNITNNSAFSSDLSVNSATPNVNNLTKNIYKLWQNGQLCDVIITADKQTFYAHHLVMAASCENLSKSVDSTTHPTYRYDFPNVRPEVMDEILKFLYTSRLNINSNNLEELLETSQSLGIRKLLDLCTIFLTNITLNNAIRNRSIAKKFGLSQVVVAIDSYVHEHFATLVTTSSFLKSSFRLLYDIISSGILTEPDELQIFHACAKWIGFNPQDRMQYTVPLMSLIRFNLIPATDIVSQVEPVKMIFDHPECKDMLYNAFRHHALFETETGSSRGGYGESVNVKDYVQKKEAMSSEGQQTNYIEAGSEHIAPEVSTDYSSTSGEFVVQEGEFAYDTAGSAKPEDKEEKWNTQVKIQPTAQQGPDTRESHVVGSSWIKVYPDEEWSTQGEIQPTPDQQEPDIRGPQLERRRNSTVPNVDVKIECYSAKSTSSAVSTLSSVERVSAGAIKSNSRSKPSGDELTVTPQSSLQCRRKISRDDLAQYSDFTKESVQSTLNKCQNAKQSSSTGTHKSQERGNDNMAADKDHHKFKIKPSDIAACSEKLKSATNLGSNNLSRNSCRRHSFPPFTNFTQLSPIKSEPSVASPLPLPSDPTIIFVVGGCAVNGSEHKIHTLQQYVPELDTWSFRSQIPVPVHHCAVAVLHNYLYVIGGQSSARLPIKECYRFDIGRDRWERIASINTARIRHAAVVLNRKIYIIGGEDCIGMSSKTVEVYDPWENKWKHVSAMHEHRAGLSAVAHRSRLLVAGGIMDMDGRLLLDTVEMYDPRTKAWTFRKSLPFAVCDSSLVEISGVVYLVGGLILQGQEPLSVDSIFRYIYESDTWEGYTRLYVPRHEAIVTSVGSKMYIIGGESSAAPGNPLSNVECIDVQTDERVTDIAPLLSTAYGIRGCSFRSDG